MLERNAFHQKAKPYVCGPGVAWVPARSVAAKLRLGRGWIPSKSGWVLEIVMLHQFARGWGVGICRQERPGACGSRCVLGVDFWGLEGVGYKGRVALGSCQLRGLNRQENRGYDENQLHV